MSFTAPSAAFLAGFAAVTFRKPFIADTHKLKLRLPAKPDPLFACPEQTWIRVFFSWLGSSFYIRANIKMIDTDEEERPLDVHEVTLVVNLLTETDITLTEIADRIQCPLSAVNAINRKFSARDFRERRSLLTVPANAVGESPVTVSTNGAVESPGS